MNTKHLLNKKILFVSFFFLASVCFISYNSIDFKHIHLFSSFDNEAGRELQESKNKLQFIEAQWRQEFDRTKDPETGLVPKERIFDAIEYKENLIALRFLPYSSVVKKELFDCLGKNKHCFLYRKKSFHSKTRDQRSFLHDKESLKALS